MSERPKRTGCMFCSPFEEKRLAKWEPPYFVQPKLDGERCRIIVQNGIVLMLSSTEEIITSCPHIAQRALEKLPAGEYDGELYRHGWSFEKIHSVVSRRVNLHPDHKQIQFHCFDVVENAPQLVRLGYLCGMSAWDDLLVLVGTNMAIDLPAIMNLLEFYANLGYEGIIVRHHAAPYVRKCSTFVMKYKPAQADAYLITGTFEEIDKFGSPKGTLGGLICSGAGGTPFRVGSGFSREQRQTYWEARNLLPGYYVKVKYQHLTPGRGCPRFPIFCSIITPNEANAIENKEL